MISPHARRPVRRRAAVIGAALVLSTAAVGCGSSGDDDADAAAEDTSELAPDDAGGTDDAADATGIGVSLVEWAVEAPAEYTAGSTTFQVSNGGSFPHELVVIAGDGYESLPLAANGAVLEDELAPDAILGRTARLSPGDSEQLTVDLPPGNYVLLCNIAVGPNSHAGQGQWLDVTVG